MPRYDFRCEKGHVTELTFAMADVPADVRCGHGAGARRCAATAARAFTAPIIQIHGRGSLLNAVTGRRRRPNPGDDLPREHDAVADAIARSV